jgi:hypothetical protein
MGLDELSKELRELEAGRDRVLKAYSLLPKKKQDKSLGIFLVVVLLIALGYCLFILLNILNLNMIIIKERVEVKELEIKETIVLNNTYVNNIVEIVEIESNTVSKEAVDYLNHIVDKTIW